MQEIIQTSKRECKSALLYHYTEVNVYLLHLYVQMQVKVHQVNNIYTYKIKEI